MKKIIILFLALLMLNFSFANTGQKSTDQMLDNISKDFQQMHNYFYKENPITLEESKIYFKLDFE